MTIDREQIRRDMAHQIEVGSGFGFPSGHWVGVLADVLAELEQAERERDEQATLAETRKVSRREYRERAEAAERRETALAEALREIDYVASLSKIGGPRMDGLQQYTSPRFGQIRDFVREALAVYEASRE